MIKTVTVAAFASMLLATNAYAQMPGPATSTLLREGQKDIAAQSAPRQAPVSRRYTYSKPNHAPCVANLDKLFPGVVRMTGKEYVEIIDGKKGEVPKRELERCIGMAYYTDPALLAKGDLPKGYPLPDPAFMAALRDRLASHQYIDKLYSGLRCKMENGAFVGDCNSDLTGVMAYRGTVTELPPTMIGFDMGALLLNDVEIIGGPRDGEWVKPVVTSYVVLELPNRNPETGRLFSIEQPCANWTSEDGQAPAPVVAAVVPPPAPAPVVSVPLPVPTVAPRPMVQVRTTDLAFYKEFWKGDKPVKNLPDNANELKFEATVGTQTYPAYVVRHEQFTRRDPQSGKMLEGERVMLSVPNVALDRTTLMAMIQEVNAPDGWRARTKNGISIAVPSDGNWMGATRTNEMPIFINEKKPCRFAKLPCWAWPIIGGAVATPFLIPHHPPVVIPPVACNPAVQKCGGAGNSPR